MLARHVIRLERRLERIEERFVAQHSALSNASGLQRWFELEGMLSQSWQVWCVFCREAFIQSCLGTKTTGGNVTVCDPDWTDWQRVAYVATCHAKSQTPKPGKTLGTIRHEFTWGDINALLRATAGVRPTNWNSLMSGFGLSVNGARHLQVVRNACAHLNSESQFAVKSLTPFYSGSGLRHPADIVLWQDSSTGYPVLMSWFDDLRNMAVQAVV